MHKRVVWYNVVYAASMIYQTHALTSMCKGVVHNQEYGTTSFKHLSKLYQIHIRGFNSFNLRLQFIELYAVKKVVTEDKKDRMPRDF